MAPSVKIGDGIDCRSGTSFEAALGMLETSIGLGKSKKRNSQSSRTSASSLPSKSRQHIIKKIDEDIKAKKNKKECSTSSSKKKTTSNRSGHDKENSNQTGHMNKETPKMKSYQSDKEKIISSNSGGDKKLEDRNKANSGKKRAQSHKTREKRTSDDYENKNKSTKKKSHKDRHHIKRHSEPSMGREAKKQKPLENNNQTEANKSKSNNYCPYSRVPNGKIDFEQLIEAGTVSVSEAMELLLDSVPEIADVSVDNQKRRSIRGPHRINAAKHNQNKLYAGHESSLTKVPSLVNICNAFFQDNLSLIGYTGGAPYSVMKPILERATPGQLYRIEFNNQYLIDGQTDELWQLHCKRDLPYRKKSWWESYRDMYIHYEMERLTRLGVLKGNTKSQAGYGS